MPSPSVIADALVAAWNAGDAARFAALFADDAEFVNVVGLWWRSRDAIEKAHAYGFEKIFPGSTMRVVKRAIRDVGNDAAVAHLEWRLEHQAPPPGAAQAPGARRGVMSFVVANGQIVSLHNTDRIEGADTLLAGGAPARYGRRSD